MRFYSIIIYVSALLILPVLWGCKPTEKGYREAYEIAKQKEREGLDDETYEKMSEQSKPALAEIDGVKMRRKGEFLSVIYPDDLAKTMQLKRYNPTVGSYKMLFNAKSHVDRLRTDGLPAVLLKGPGSIYYVCIGSYETEKEAADACRKYNRSHKGQFVGMDEPLLLITAH